MEKVPGGRGSWARGNSVMSFRNGEVELLRWGRGNSSLNTGCEVGGGWGSNGVRWGDRRVWGVTWRWRGRFKRYSVRGIRRRLRRGSWGSSRDGRWRRFCRGRRWGGGWVSDDMRHSFDENILLYRPCSTRPPVPKLPLSSRGSSR